MNASASAPASRGSDAVVADLLDQVANQIQAGEPVDVEALLTAHPEHADRLRRLLPAAQVLAELERSGKASVPVPGEMAELEQATLGDFRILREVGRGGMGVVFEAEQISLRRRVALKLLPFAGTLDPRQLQRFKTEAQAAAQLHHTNIVPVHYVGCERGVHYYAMQFIDGRTLAQVIDELRAADTGRPAAPRRSAAAEGDVTADAPSVIAPAGAVAAPTGPVAGLTTVPSARDAAYYQTVARLGIQAAEALDCAHQQGVIHRDVKPANMMVETSSPLAPGGRGAGGEGLRLWVMDFGLAHVQNDTRLTMSGDLVGTLRYMSPEQALGRRMLVDHRTDVYSLGATLYELLTLEPAFGATDRQELLRQIAFDEPAPPRRRNKAVPAELETIVLKALEKDPAERYATAQALADDLRSWLEDRPILAKQPSLAQRLAKWHRRHRALVRAAGALCLVVLLLVGTALWWRHQERAAVERAAVASIARADLLGEQDRWDQAHTVLATVDAQLAGHGLDAARDRVQHRLREADMVTRLEKVRFQLAMGGRDDAFNTAGADRLYGEAFQWYGLDVPHMDPADAAERVRASPIRKQLIAALDDWAVVRAKLARGSEQPYRLVADSADDDPWVRRVREVTWSGKVRAVERMAEETDPLTQPPTNLVRLARALSGAERWSAAERLLRRAQQKYPADFWINFELAGVLEHTPTADPVVANRQSQSGRQAVYTLSKPANAAERVRYYQAALALQPRSSAVYHNLSRALEDQGRLDEALAMAQEAVRLSPDNAEDHNRLGTILYARRQDDAAITAYREAIRLDPGLAFAHNNLGLALARKGKLDEAMAAYREAIRLKSDYAEAHGNLGLAFAGQGKLDDAIGEMQTATRIRPGMFEAWLNLGALLSMRHRYDEAIPALQAAIGLNRGIAGIHSELALALQAKGRWTEALAEHSKALGLAPEDPLVCNNMAAFLVTCADRKLRDPHRAVALATQAVQSLKTDPGVRSTLGQAYYRAGDWHAAVKALDKATELRKGAGGEDWFYLAMAHWQLGHRDRARQWYAKADAWLAKNGPPEDDVRAARAEAAGLLGVPPEPAPRARKEAATP